MKRTLTLMAFVALSLTGCSSTDSDVAAESDDPQSRIPIETIEPQTDWIDEDQKLRTFLEYVCIRDGVKSELEPHIQANTAAVGVLADSSSSPKDKRIALEITTRPADAYEDDLAWAEATGEELPATSVPRTLTPNNPGICEGWVWEKHLEQAYLKEFDTFTFKQAREMNAI